MKLLSLLSGCIVFLILLSTSTQITSCKKDPEIVRDTVIIKDTVKLPCNCDELSLKEGLVAYYNFNNGTLNDSSGKNNHITFNNATKTTDRLGRANNAFLFDGSTSFMRVPSSNTLSPANGITIMATVKINGFYAGQCHGNQVLGKTGPFEHVNGHYAMRFDDNNCNNPLNPDNMVIRADYGNNSPVHSEPADTAKVRAGNWYTFVFTAENGVKKMYINGVLKMVRNGNTVFTANNHDLVIGKKEDAIYPFWFNGVIDEIRIYDRALCEEKVKKLGELTQ